MGQISDFAYMRFSTSHAAKQVAQLRMIDLNSQGLADKEKAKIGMCTRSCSKNWYVYMCTRHAIYAFCELINVHLCVLPLYIWVLIYFQIYTQMTTTVSPIYWNQSRYFPMNFVCFKTFFK